MTSRPAKIAILGASGYTGAELVRLLSRHSGVEIVAMTADRKAGEPFREVYPHLGQVSALPPLTRVEDVDWAGVEFVFCGLPHGTTQEIIAGLPDHVRIVDLSADFRLYDLEAYKVWYGHEHRAPELQKQAVYGLTEIKRDAIRSARLVANPGCYTTAAELPLIPLLAADQIVRDNIIIDAKSGVTGAGRAPKEGTLYAEVAEGIHAYGIAKHRHGVEIDQELSEAAGEPVMATFTPHLMPMNRGILSTIYVSVKPGVTAEDLHRTLDSRYADEPFVGVLPIGETPATRHVRGSNYTLIGVVADRVPGRVIIVTALDNLVKGASGQAIQNMNVMLGLPETLGLDQQPLFP